MTLRPRVKAKIRAQLAQAELARAMLDLAYGKHSEIASELVAATRELHRLQSADERRRWIPPAQGPGLPGGVMSYDEALRVAAARVERLKERRQRAAAQLEAARETREALERPLESLAAYLASTRHAVEPAKPMEYLEAIAGGSEDAAATSLSVLPLSAREAQKLAGIRARLDSNGAALANVTAARLTDAEIAERVRRELLDYGRDADGALGALAYSRDDGGVVQDVLGSPRGLVAVLGDELLVPLITRRVLEHAGDGAAISAKERDEQLERLHRERSKLEHDEEREILRLETSGWIVARRRDVNWQLVLEMWAKEVPDESKLAAVQ